MKQSARPLQRDEGCLWAWERCRCSKLSTAGTSRAGGHQLYRLSDPTLGYL